jgi:hypothetical protein
MQNISKHKKGKLHNNTETTKQQHNNTQHKTHLLEIFERRALQVKLVDVMLREERDARASVQRDLAVVAVCVCMCVCVREIQRDLSVIAVCVCICVRVRENE